MALSEVAIKNAKPGARPIKLFDGGGLFLLLNPNGSRWWRLKYRINGRERGLSLGVYPDVSLKQARERRDEARKLIASGTDPSVHRQSAKVARTHTFETIGREWLAMQTRKISEVTLTKKKWMLEAFVFPDLGSKPISEIKAPDILAILWPIEARNKHETAHRTKQECGRIFRYAVATGRAERDITADLRGALAPIVSKNRAAITEPARIGDLLRAIEGYDGQPSTACALKLAAYTFVRPGELRAAEWSEFDLDKAEWRIPGARMKMREQHIVPLAQQAIELLRAHQLLTGSGHFVFPSLLSAARPMSESSVNAALRRLGYSKEEMTGHGFRALASTCLNEQDWHPDLIELQLAHAERNKIRAAYNRAQRLTERRKMMQAWADYLDGLRVSTAVVPFKQTG